MLSLSIFQKGLELFELVIVCFCESLVATSERSVFCDLHVELFLKFRLEFGGLSVFKLQIRDLSLKLFALLSGSDKLDFQILHLLTERLLHFRTFLLEFEVD